MAKIKPKKKNKSTAKILVLAVVVILLICTTLFVKNSFKPKKINKEIKWKEVVGEQIPSAYEMIESKSYEEYSYNLDTNEIKNSFTVLLPSDIKLENMSTNSIEYKTNNSKIIVTKTMVNSEKEELKRLEEQYSTLYDKFQIKSTTYDKNIFAVILEYGKYNEDLSMISFNQEVRIYIKANNDKEYALIQLIANEKRIEEETISKIINSITINKNQITFCKNGVCEANLNVLHNTLKNIVTINVNKNKYVHQNDLGLSMYNANFVNKAYFNESDEDKAIKKLTKIDIKFLYGNDYKENIKNMNEIKVNGKKVYATSNVLNVDEMNIYEGTYIYEISNNLFLRIGINSRLNNLEEVIKDFLNFELK